MFQGNSEQPRPIWNELSPVFVAKRNNDYSFTRLKIINQTDLLLEQVQSTVSNLLQPEQSVIHSFHCVDRATRSLTK